MTARDEMKGNRNFLVLKDEWPKVEIFSTNPHSAKVISSFEKHIEGKLLICKGANDGCPVCLMEWVKDVCAWCNKEIMWAPIAQRWWHTGTGAYRCVNWTTGQLRTAKTKNKIVTEVLTWD